MTLVRYINQEFRLFDSNFEEFRWFRKFRPNIGGFWPYFENFEISKFRRFRFRFISFQKPIKTDPCSKFRNTLYYKLAMMSWSDYLTFNWGY